LAVLPHGRFLGYAPSEARPYFAALGGDRFHVLTETVRCLANLNWRLALLPPWYAVDTVADWRILSGHLLALRRAGMDPDVY
jgi:hypothetical protein